MNNIPPRASGATIAWTALSTILLASFAFVALLTTSKSGTIQKNINVLQFERDHYRKIDTCISLLYSAENNSRFFIVSQDSAYIKDYTRQLQLLVRILDDYQAEREDTETPFSKLVFEKRLLNQEFINLRLMVDSLLSSSMSNVDPKFLKPESRTEKRHFITQTKDIESSASPKKRNKRNLVKRLVDAIRDKEPVDSSIVRNRSSTVVRKDSVNLNLEPLSIKNNETIAKARKELGMAEQHLLSINSLLFANLQKALQDLKRQEQADIESLRSSLLDATKRKSEEIGALIWVNLVPVFALTVVIILNLLRLYKKDATILAFAGVTAEASKRKGEFLAQVTHEFRTPLNAIIGFSNLIDMEKLDQESQANVGSIKSASLIMLSLVNEVLDFSKIESAKITLVNKPFSPVALVRESISLLSVLAKEKRIEILTHFDLNDHVTLMGDSFRIQQIVINLMSNAIKFTPEFGTISINMRFKNLNKNKGLLTVSVKDSGVGIAQEHLSAIFQDFIQVQSSDVKARNVGTGLGLAICKRIVNLYDGQIHVESTLGRGSEFTFQIPLEVTQHIETATAAVEINTKSLLRTRKLLIADDTKMNLLLVSRIIDKLGGSYDLAENGQIAFELFKINTYDLVITDISMPIMDGIEFTKLIRSTGAGDKAKIPIIGFTAYTDEEKLAHYKAIGINEILPKPFEENHFTTLLSRLLALA
jgi:signal transduction histidine kinase